MSKIAIRNELANWTCRLEISRKRLGYRYIDVIVAVKEALDEDEAKIDATGVFVFTIFEPVSSDPNV